MSELTIEEQLQRDGSLVLLYGWVTNLVSKGYATLEQEDDNVIVNCDAAVSNEFGCRFCPEEKMPNLEIPPIIRDYFFAVPWKYARMFDDTVTNIELVCGAFELDSNKLIIRLPVIKEYIDDLKGADMIVMTDLVPVEDDAKLRYVMMRA